MSVTYNVVTLDQQIYNKLNTIMYLNLELMDNTALDIMKGFGTFFMPSRWVGKKISFPRMFNVGDPRIKEALKKYPEIVYDNEFEDLKIFVCRDGFIGICEIIERSKTHIHNMNEEDIKKKRSLDMLQVIMGIALILGEEMFSIRPNDIFTFGMEINDKKISHLGFSRKSPLQSSRDEFQNERKGTSYLFPHIAFPLQSIWELLRIRVL